MVERRGALRLPVNGEEVSVPSALHLSCPKCGEIVLRFQDAKRLHEVDSSGKTRPAEFTDVRKLLEDKSIDAISIATPYLWH
jgi:hypothetical protein